MAIGDWRLEDIVTERELKDRTKSFALRTMKLAAALPSNTVGRAIARQIVRSGTSVAANYRAACRGRSKAEFVAKLGIVEEEADETMLWLELIAEGGLMPTGQVQALLDEANEITAIMAASRISARRRADGPRKSQVANRKLPKA